MDIKRFVGGTLMSNGYIISVKDQGGCYIIDPGYAPKKFVDYVRQEKLTALGVILTHHHHDHTGGATKVAEALACPIFMHEIDAYRYQGRVDRYLADGDVLSLDGERLLVRHTPGHTAGSICILSEKSKVVFSGDTIFDTDLGRTDLADGSPMDMQRTCREVIDQWENAYRVYPGHDESATMKEIRKNNQEFLACLSS